MTERCKKSLNTDYENLVHVYLEAKDWKFRGWSALQDSVIGTRVSKNCLPPLARGFNTVHFLFKKKIYIKAKKS